jgi:hypothetical protein
MTHDTILPQPAAADNIVTTADAPIDPARIVPGVPIRMRPDADTKPLTILIAQGDQVLERCTVAIAHTRVTAYRKAQADAAPVQYVEASPYRKHHRDRYRVEYDPNAIDPWTPFALLVDGRFVGYVKHHLDGEMEAERIMAETPDDPNPEPPCDPACEIDGWCRVCVPFALDPNRQPDAIDLQCAAFAARMKGAA